MADSPIHPANFCQLDGSLPEPLLWRDHVAVLSAAQGAIAVEVFHPKLSAGGLDNRFSDRKPQGASSLLRRPKAIAVSMPEASPSELLASFLRMRDQVCIDLGISPLKDDTLEAYMAKVQRTAFEMRDAVQQKHFAIGLSQVYYRRKVNQSAACARSRTVLPALLRPTALILLPTVGP